MHGMYGTSTNRPNGTSGIALLIFVLLALITIALTLKTENLTLVALILLWGIGIQYSLPKFVLSIINKFRKKTAEDIAYETIEKQEQEQKDKEAHDKFFKGQGY